MIGGGHGRDHMVVGYLYLNDIKHLKPNHQTYDWLANRFRISVRQTTTEAVTDSPVTPVMLLKFKVHRGRTHVL
jgi:hypothetical protein